MEQEDSHLAAQYLQDFDIGHLEDVNVKKEVHESMNGRLPSMMCGMVAPPLLTPPQEDWGAPLYPGTPGTPPDTPPGSGSPGSPRWERGPALEEVVWLPQPLDLRPHCGPELEEWKCAPLAPYHHHPEEPPLARVTEPPPDLPGPEDIISDNELMGLSVRDLNKRLQGYPREIVVKLKQKRRTLKNRGYAHNCRSKRVHQRMELEMMNRELQNDLHRAKAELARLSQEVEAYRQERDFLKQERDMYKHRLEQIRKREHQLYM